MAEEKQGMAAEGAESVEQEQDLLSSILGQKKPDAQERLKHELKEYVDSITKGEVVAEDAVKAIDANIAQIDALLSAQMDEILHNEKFQKLESTWRGLKYLVDQSNASSMLKLKVINVPKKELLKDLQNASEFDQSAMFKKIYEEEFGTAGGAPFGALVGDYYFNVRDNEDMTILEHMSGIAAASHAPFLTSTSAETFGLDSFEKLGDPRDLAKIFDPKLNPDMARWNAFREWEDARYVGLCMPRALLRLPYGEKTDKVDLFSYEEGVDGSDHGKYLWGNAAWTLAARMTDAFNKYGWCVNITGREGGGTVEGLPLHTFKTDTGEIAYKVPTEVAITDRRDGELDNLGFIPLCHYKDTNYAVFFKTHSAQKPKVYDDPDASANAELSVHLTYLMAVSRFAHYMKVMLRDKLGTLQEGSDLEAFLNKWFSNYTLADPTGAGVNLKAQKPLREFSVSVKPVEGRPGSYEADLHLRPHYQLQDINMSLHLVSTVSKN
ncbi:MAG: type VI secretion system contractile sheath large subunit [Chitinivibrionales bacterium]|nr:type VI secretion system contractile sheath large subunit [Chitinivibrionales bacterium]MBD3358475.1 type VI secretion system contractile sheath large subunit [Chitinivibrionales bacterium]